MDIELCVVEVDLAPAEAVVLPQEEAANILATFWDRVFTEFDVAKHVQSSGPSSSSAVMPRVMPQLGKKLERETKSPESISCKAFAHCLLEPTGAEPEHEEQNCWDELADILEACGRPGLADQISAPSSASACERRALARKLFVATLGEWVNMHDGHAPFPMGPPGKDHAPLWRMSSQRRSAALAISSIHASVLCLATKRSMRIHVDETFIGSGLGVIATSSITSSPCCYSQ